MTEEIDVNDVKQHVNKHLINNHIDGKEASIDNNDSNTKSEKQPVGNKHILTITPQIKLVEIKPQAAPFLFRLINENRYVMSEHIPYFQRIQGINDVVEFIRAKHVRVIETDYLYALLNNNKNTIKGKQTTNGKNNIDIENTIEKNFLYFINYEKIPIGVIGLLNIDWYNKIGEIHFWITARFQRKGFMSQVLPKILDYLFYDVRLNRITAKLRSNNNPAKMLLKKFGFMLEGIERQSFYFIPDNDKENDENKMDKLKKQVDQIRRRRHNRSGKNESSGIYYDMCVYSLISRDYV